MFLRTILQIIPPPYGITYDFYFQTRMREINILHLLNSIFDCYKQEMINKLFIFYLHLIELLRFQESNGQLLLLLVVVVIVVVVQLLVSPTYFIHPVPTGGKVS